MNSKIALLWTRVVNKPSYAGTELRRLNTYLKFNPEIPHDLIVVNRNGDIENDIVYTAITDRVIRHDGDGWDCGTWKDVGGSLTEYDLVVCCNSSVYFHRPGWLERLDDEFKRNGPGLYGPLGSFEYEPHLRTPCLAFSPSIIKQYPEQIKTRTNTYQFEALGYPDTPNFTLWCKSKGFVVLMVTFDGAYQMDDWRKPDNVFRKGDQSNCLVWDRHCDVYFNSSPEEKIKNQQAAGG